MVGNRDVWAFGSILSAAEAHRTPKADALERDSWQAALKLMTARAKQERRTAFIPRCRRQKINAVTGNNDSGSFIVSHDGNPVFIDLVPEAYSVKRFGPDRYSLWTMQSAFHNLPTAGGVMPSSAEPPYR